MMAQEHLQKSHDPDAMSPVSATAQSGRLTRLLARFDIRAERIIVVQTLAEAALAWLAINALLGSGDGASRVPATTVIALALVASLTPRVLVAFAVWPPRYELVMLIGVAFSAAFTIKTAAFPDVAWGDPGWLRQTSDALILRPSDASVPVWLLVGLIVVAWVWGRRRPEPGLDAQQSIFRVGALILAVVAVLSVLSEGVDDGDIIGAAAAFFGLSLLGIGWSRQDMVHPGARSSNTAAGLATMAAVGTTLLLALLLAGLATRGLLDTLVWALTPIWFAIRLLLEGVALIVVSILVVILYPLFWFIENREGEPAAPLDSEQVGAAPSGNPESLNPEDVLTLPDPIRYVLAAVVLVIIGGLLIRFGMSKLNRPPASDEIEQRIEVDFRDWFSRLRQWRPQRQEHDLSDPLAAIRGDDRWQYTLAIRETYAAFLDRARVLDVPRLQGETAHHHATRVAATGRPDPADVATLDGIYARIRYGAPPANARDAHDAQAAWQRIAIAISDDPAARTGNRTSTRSYSL